MSTCIASCPRKKKAAVESRNKVNLGRTSFSELQHSQILIASMQRYCIHDPKNSRGMWASTLTAEKKDFNKKVHNPIEINNTIDEIRSQAC